MRCPFCKMEMEKGVISGDRYSLKWIEEDRNKGAIINAFKRGIKITNPWGTNQVETYLCRDCKKMIIDIEDLI